MIRKNGAGALVNPEFGIDLSDVVIYDVGYALYPFFPLCVVRGLCDGRRSVTRY